MEAVMLAKCASFHCLAGTCPSTCCSGWSIQVDARDYQRFEVLEPEWLRKDILGNIHKKKQNYFFKHQRDGRCAMLDADGLCRIQRNTSEEALCNTCRKYPRLVNRIAGTVYISMAASCPVISEYLVKERVGWQAVEESGKVKGLKVEELPLIKHVWGLYGELWQSAEELLQTHSNIPFLYQCFEKMAAGILDILIRHPSESIPVSFFETLEKDVSGQIDAFVEREKACWSKISDNYTKYRILSRKTEFPEEEDFQCIRQAQGELLLLRMLAFCRYCEKGALQAGDWQELLQRVYRFCAHGEKVSEAFQKLLKEFFSRDVLWSYLLK